MNSRTNSSHLIPCLYRNETARMQIARIDNAPEFYLERVILPGQCLMFEAPASAHLEIHSGTMVTSILEDTIPCEQLHYCVGNETVVAFPAAQDRAAA